MPLAVLLFVAQLPDWIDVGICAAGMSRGPAGLHSHGFFILGVSIGLVSAVYLILARDFKGALLIALVGLSHYGLDLLTGIKPTWDGGPIIGLGLYRSPLADGILEIGTIVGGWMLYRAGLPQEKKNSALTVGILVTLIVFQVAAGLAFYLNLGGDVKC